MNESIEYMKLDLLVFAAHPDDAELACSGTIFKYVKKGLKVGIIDLTQGELGTRGTPELRLQEAKAAAEILGISLRKNLGMRDGFIEHSEENIRKVMVQIRLHCPSIILCNAPNDRHPDHGMASELVRRASFLAGLQKFETTFQNQIQRSHRPSLLLQYIQDYYLTPNIILDISEEMPYKIKSILAYSSQFYQKNNSGPETPISREDFIPFIEGRARNYGRMIGTTFAEGFICERPLGVNDLFNLL